MPGDSAPDQSVRRVTVFPADRSHYATIARHITGNRFYETSILRAAISAATTGAPSALGRPAMFSTIGRSLARTAHRGLFLLAAIVVAIAAGWLSPVAAGDTLPVKLEIVPSANAVEVGDSVILNVVLRGADNAVAVAPRAFNVRFEMKTP